MNNATATYSCILHGCSKYSRPLIIRGHPTFKTAHLWKVVETTAIWHRCKKCLQSGGHLCWQHSGQYWLPKWPVCRFGTYIEKEATHDQLFLTHEWTFLRRIIRKLTNCFGEILFSLSLSPHTVSDPMVLSGGSVRRSEAAVGVYIGDYIWKDWWKGR